MSRVVPNFDMPELDMSERIEKMRSRLQGRQNDGDLSAIEARLERVEEKLDQLLAEQTPVKAQPKHKPSTKKTAPKKGTTTRKTAKPD